MTVICHCDIIIFYLIYNLLHLYKIKYNIEKNLEFYGKIQLLPENGEIIKLIIYKNKLYKERKLPKKLIITPHTGELSRLTGLSTDYINNNRVEAAKKASEELGAIVVLKGNESLVCSENPSREIYINTTGNAGMATGGSGDVLAGILAGLTAADGGKSTYFEIACCGVFIHGLCGDMASAKYGQRAVKAGDLIEMLKEVVLL